MAKSDARFGYRSKLSRQDHDILKDPRGFTCCPGQLCPIFHDIATPGDTYYIEHDLNFLRTQPLAAPAMVDVIVHYETFFVPFQMIYQPIENTVFSIKPIQSSNFSPSALLNNQLPLFDYNYYRDNLIGSAPNSISRTLAFRLADFLNLNPLAWLNVSTDPSSSLSPNFENYVPNFFPYSVLAYHTIFQYYYRLDDKSEFDNVNCNWDRYYNVSTPVQISPTASPFFTILQRPLDFDYYTSIYRAPIVSSNNVQQVMGSGSYSDLVSRYMSPITSVGSGSYANDNTRAFSGGAAGSFDSNNLQSLVSTAMIRQIFANEKLAMITGRTKKNYDSQVLAHFGVKVPHDVKHDITLIGDDHFRLQVGEVTSLASTTGSPLGELAGKAWASGKGKKHKFTAPCHGIIMTIFSIEPKKRYTVGFSRDNSIVNAFDFPVPEFDRMGNVPMYRYETGYLASNTNYTDVIGWKERYYAFKRRPSMASVAFLRPRRQTSVSVNSFTPYMIVSNPFGLAGHIGNASSNASRPDLEERFYINSNDLDELMLVNYVETWQGSSSALGENWDEKPWMVYNRDPFIVDSFEKVKKVSWMSKDGEPVYNF